MSSWIPVGFITAEPQWELLHAVFNSSCTIFYSRQQCTRIPISLHPLQHLLFSGFYCYFLVAILVGLEWYLSMVNCYFCSVLENAFYNFFDIQVLPSSCIHCLIHHLSLSLSLFFFFFCYIQDIWKFLGQGSNLSCGCDLCHSCSNARSLTHCRARD